MPIEGVNFDFARTYYKEITTLYLNTLIGVIAPGIILYV